MPFPVSPNPGDSYTDAYGTVWIYAGSVNGWYRQTVIPGNETSYTADLITTDKIIDNTIINADVASNAAIAGTKISPNFGSQTIQTTGVFSHALGTAGAPTITFTGDPNTGIYSPGADQLALSTNGTGRLFIDANGRVGIGTATVNLGGWGNAVTLQGVSNAAYEVTDGSVRTSLIAAAGSFGIVGTDTNHPFYIRTNSTERLRITSTGQLSHIGAGSSGSPAVSFSGSAASNSLVVDSSSRVGIGTSSPQVNLDVRGTINAGNGTTRWGLIGTDTDGAYLGTAGINHPWIFKIGNGSTDVERMRLTSTGLGIGTTSPQASLDVTTGIRVNSTGVVTSGFANGINVGTWDLLGFDGSDVVFGGYRASQYNQIRFYNGGTERARIDSSGRLLVGTSTNSGGALLQVNGDRIRVATAKTPASATDTGTAGEICWDANYIYVCTATNTWKRTAIATW